MKLLLVTSNIYSATGMRAFINIANALHRRGHEVILLVHKKGIERRQRPFYPLDEGVEIRNARPWKHEESGPHDRVVKASPDRGHRAAPATVFVDGLRRRAERFFRRLRRKVGLIIHRDVHGRGFWEARFAPKIKRLRNAILEVDPDVVVSFLPSSFPYVSAALDGLDYPFVVANRNSPFKDFTVERFFPSHYDVEMRFRAVERCALNLVQLDAYREFFSTDVQRKTRVIPNWVEPIPEERLAQPGVEGDRNLILAVGRLHEQKNHELLIRAFATIKDRYPTWEVAIAGAGELEGSLQSLIEELGVEHRVQLLGARKDVDALYARAKIFAFPSRWEGFSNAHLESMAHGLPTVGLRSCMYMREILGQSKGGLLADDDVTDYTQRLASLIEAPGERVLLGRNAREFAHQFEHESITDRWEAVLEEAHRTHRHHRHQSGSAEPGADS